MTRSLLLILILTCSGIVNAQKTANLWNEIPEADIEMNGIRYISASKYKTFRLNLDMLSQILVAAPLEFTPVAQMTKTYIQLPDPTGKLITFDLVESPVLEAELAIQHPNISTFTAYDIEGRGYYAKLDYTPQGFHAMVIAPEGKTFFIDPFSFGSNLTDYIVYYRKDFISTIQKTFVCEVDDYLPMAERSNAPDLKSAYGTCELRTYRLALACTGEYAQFHGGTVNGALAAQVTSMNRVNGLYEKDLAIRMNIISNNNLIIYTNAGSDPYTNNNGGTMLTENVNNLGTVIGNANFDIGHVFSTGGGGIAGLRVVCGTGKARGVTGSAAPIGDPFDIDYVAHEMGHQFGANHTQNNNCNRNSATAMETGSASTIMGYAGICAPNVQNNSDDYFHNISLQEIGAFITGTAHTCPVKTPLANNGPTVTVSAATVNIPRSTPFSLTATGVDPNATNVLTYCWEQMNSQTSTQPPVATATGGPNFRSFDPSTSPTRYFPSLSALASNGPFTWEVLPSVARTMAFRVALRDNAPGGGCTASANVTVNVDGNSGPFEVTYPTATGISWAGNSTQTVTWNVANTTNTPVSCANVDILISTNGGQTYTVLLSNTPNDGTQSITVPNTPSTTCRIMVRCANGYFFDISNNNFTITGATFDYTLNVSNLVLAVCQPNNAVFNIQIGAIGGFSNTVNLTVSGLPVNAVATFGSSAVTPVDSTTLTISGIGSVVPGTYSIRLSASSTSGTKNIDLTLVVSSSIPTAVSLTTPANASIGNNNPRTFTWTASAGAGISYIIEIASDANFTNIVEIDTVTVNSYTATSVLASGATYYWRVTSVTGCGIAPASSVFSFTMSTCSTYASTNVPLNISATGIVTVNSTLAVPLTGTITDVNITNLVGTHTYVQDLVCRLRSPALTTRTVFRRPCGDFDNFNIKFDDDAASATLPCPLTGGAFYKPLNNFAAFNGQASNGTWQLTIIDSANVDGGTLTAWSLQVCIATPASCALSSNISNLTNVTCFNGTNGSATVNPTGTAPYNYNWSNGSSSATVNNLAAGTYNVTVNDANGCTATNQISITQPSALTSSTLVVDGCVDLGSINLSLSGATAPYSFIWSGNQTTEDISGLASGSYQVSITDANGCTSVQSATVTLFATAVINPVQTNSVSCFGLQDGSIDIDVIGAPAFVYSWSNGSTTQDLSGLASGSYTLTLTDANGCTIVYTDSVSSPLSTLSSSSTVTDESAPGANDGIIDLQVAGGTSPYSYQWSNGATTQNISGVGSGPYSVTITDSNGCTLVQNLTLVVSLSAFDLNNNLWIQPNPSFDGYFYLYAGNEETQFIGIQVVDVLGRELIRSEVSINQVNSSLIDLSHFSDAVYFVICRQSSKENQIFKIVKTSKK